MTSIAKTGADIEGNIKRVLFGEIKIDKWKEARLVYPPLVTGGAVPVIELGRYLKLGEEDETEIHRL